MYYLLAFVIGVTVCAITVALYCERCSLELAKLDKIYKLYANARSDISFMSDVGKILELRGNDD